MVKNEFDIAKALLKRSVKTFEDLERYVNFVDIYDGDKWSMSIEESDFTLPENALIELKDLVSGALWHCNTLSEDETEKHRNSIRVLLPYLLCRMGMTEGSGRIDIKAYTYVSDFDFPSVRMQGFGKYDQGFQYDEVVYYRDNHIFYIIKFSDLPSD